MHPSHNRPQNADSMHHNIRAVRLQSRSCLRCSSVISASCRSKRATSASVSTGAVHVGSIRPVNAFHHRGERRERAARCRASCPASTAQGNPAACLPRISAAICSTVSKSPWSRIGIRWNNRTAPIWQEKEQRMFIPCPMMISVEPPPMSMTPESPPSVAPKKDSAASSSPEQISSVKPVSALSSAAKSALLAASRVALVAKRCTFSAP